MGTEKETLDWVLIFDVLAVSPDDGRDLGGRVIEKEKGEMNEVGYAKEVKDKSKERDMRSKVSVRLTSIPINQYQIQKKYHVRFPSISRILIL